MRAPVGTLQRPQRPGRAEARAAEADAEPAEAGGGGAEQRRADDDAEVGEEEAARGGGRGLLQRHEARHGREENAVPADRGGAVDDQQRQHPAVRRRRPQQAVAMPQRPSRRPADQRARGVAHAVGKRRPTARGRPRPPPAPPTARRRRPPGSSAGRGEKADDIRGQAHLHRREHQRAERERRSTGWPSTKRTGRTRCASAGSGARDREPRRDRRAEARPAACRAGTAAAICASAQSAPSRRAARHHQAGQRAAQRHARLLDREDERIALGRRGAREHLRAGRRDRAVADADQRAPAAPRRQCGTPTSSTPTAQKASDTWLVRIGPQRRTRPRPIGWKPSRAR